MPQRVISYTRFISPIFLLCLLIFFTGCSSSIELSSSWNTAVVDGQAGEWSHLTSIKDTRLSFGVQNDQDFLYVCLITPEERFRRQIVFPGLKIWFEPEGGEKIGIQYPIGVSARQGALESDVPRDSEERSRMANQQFDELLILGPGKDDLTLFSILQVPGIIVKVGYSRGSAVYELRIPLKKSNDHPYALGTTSGSNVEVGIETGKVPMPRADGMDGGMRSGGGRRGRGMTGAGRPGREMGTGNRPEPLDIHLNVHLIDHSTE